MLVTMQRPAMEGQSRRSTGGEVSSVAGDLSADIQDENLRQLYQYWKAKCGQRQFPSRQDIDPLDFPYVLGWVMLIDVAHEPLQFRFRLYGTELAQRMRLDMTGKTLDQHPQPEFRAYLEQSWRTVLECRHPTHGFFDRYVDSRMLRFESLRLPLSSDGSVIDMLMIAASALQPTT